MRNVIIRESSSQKLIIYTHGLSQKVEDIKLNPNSTICWYSSDFKIQLIFYGKSHLSPQRAKIVEPTVSDLTNYKGAKPGSPYMENGEQVHFDIIEFDYNEVVALKLATEENIKYRFIFSESKVKGFRIIP